MEDIFKCPVFEKYGTRESGVIACECSVHDGMHIFAEGVYLEFLKDGRQASSGEMGEIVVTDLFNYGMPLIRYKIGDVAVVTDRKCPCGSNLLLIDKIIGRDRDILIAQDGTPKPGYLFVEVVNKHNIPARCQFVQEDVDSLLVNIVKLNGFEERYLTIIESNCKKILGGSVNVKFIFMKDIPRESSGKFKYVYSTKSPFLKNNSN
ncbi:MAG: phenylacetate--CoA ligase family protein [Nitrospirae bacterium]|nr:phenylacetate--CoA ligase family protein [Nitrospirota bacterium]